MPVLHSLPLFGLNADFFAMSLDCDSGTNILWMHLQPVVEPMDRFTALVIIYPGIDAAISG